jgi:UDP-glucose 4-epimerase
MNKILVTGGAGYIGSHTIVELLLAKHEIVVFDNLSNSNRIALERIEILTGEKITFIEGDLRNLTELESVFRKFEIDCVVHFAGLKAVSESISKPLLYYDNNVHGTLNLISVMQKYNTKKIIFSSSATVYGMPIKNPLTEDMLVGEPTNPYGASKLMIERILKDLHVSDSGWDIVILRYFNPVGAHVFGMLGEDPSGIPNNLMPLIMQTALKKRPELTVFGDSYDTPDGSCIRDYIHVVDLAKGHLAAIIRCQTSVGLLTVNLGTGKGVSVFEMISCFSRVNGVEVPFVVGSKRSGDVPVCIAGVDKAMQLLGWEAKLGLDEMCRDSWRWQSRNPNGYNG